MKTYFPLLFLLSLANGNPIGSPGGIGGILDPLFCEVNSVVIEALHQDVAATAFCSSYLSLPPASTTTTVTVTPCGHCASATITTTGLPETVNATVTRTATADITVTGVVYKTETVTTTVTRPVSLTCLSSAYTAPTVSAVTAAIQQRGEGISKPSCIPPEWPAPYISKACSCLDLSGCDATVTETLPAGTVTQTVIPTITNTISASTTITNTISTRVTSTTTVTSTITATPTVLATGTGARYRKYTHSFQSSFNSSYFKTAAPDFSGTLENLSFASPSWPSGGVTLTLADRPGAPFDASFAALLVQGFFRAPAAGAYVLGTTQAQIDNWGYLWVGDDAYAAWDDDNAAFRASGPGGAAVWQTTVTLGAGDAVPLTWLWANGGGPSQSYFRITRPDGTSTTDSTGYFVPACGDDVFP
ncbi:GLEYA domain-containing protein [Biscogniauxia mediterranea]|nr:GLEYA domain-containing protein [Biscogniauxia mediterranea]